MWASWNGREDIVKLLLNRGANVHSADYKGWTPLIYASHHGYINVIKILLKSGANVNNRDATGNNALAHSSNLKTVRFLIKNKADYKVEDSKGRNLFIIACKNWRWDFVKFYFNLGFNINSKDNLSRTALHYVVMNAFTIKIVNFLLNKNININVRDKFRKTALFYAVKAKSKKIIKILKLAGAKL